MQFKSTSIFAILALGMIAGLISAVWVNTASALPRHIIEKVGEALKNTLDKVKNKLPELGPLTGGLGCSPLDPRCN